MHLIAALKDWRVLWVWCVLGDWGPGLGAAASLAKQTHPGWEGEDGRAIYAVREMRLAICIIPVATGAAGTGPRCGWGANGQGCAIAALAGVQAGSRQSGQPRPSIWLGRW